MGQRSAKYELESHECDRVDTAYAQYSKMVGDNYNLYLSVLGPTLVAIVVAEQPLPRTKWTIRQLWSSNVFSC